LKAQKGIKFSRVWINNLIKRKKFPRPVTPGAGGAFSAKAWFEDEIDAWLNDLAAARDAIDDDESSPADQTAGLFHFRHESQAAQNSGPLRHPKP
jgi:predicted DNA-binding transcriptional regulator AlpA